MIYDLWTFEDAQAALAKARLSPGAEQNIRFFELNIHFYCLLNRTDCVMPTCLICESC